MSMGSGFLLYERQCKGRRCNARSGKLAHSVHSITLQDEFIANMELLGSVQYILVNRQSPASRIASTKTLCNKHILHFTRDDIWSRDQMVQLSYMLQHIIHRYRYIEIYRNIDRCIFKPDYLQIRWWYARRHEQLHRDALERPNFYCSSGAID